MSPQAKGGESIIRGLRVVVYLALLLSIYIPSSCSQNADAGIGDQTGDEGGPTTLGDEDFSIGVSTLSNSDWHLTPGTTNENSITITVSGASLPWKITASSASSVAANGKMAQYYNSQYEPNGYTLGYMSLSASHTITLPSTASIQEGTGPKEFVVTLNQPVSWTDHVLPENHAYRTVLTFTVAPNPG